MRQVTENSVHGITTGQFLGLADRDPLIVTRGGRPFYALLPLRGQDWESFVVSNSRVFKGVLRRARRARSRGRSMTLEETKARYGGGIPAHAH